MDPSKFRVAQLRNELQRRNLDVSGTKPILLARLRAVLDSENHFENESVDLSDASAEPLDMSIGDGANDMENVDGNGTQENNENGSAANYIILDTVDLIDADANGTDGDDSLIAETAKKVNYVLMTGQRFKSNVLYSVDEKQFYRKNKELSNGVISFDCAQKHKNKCNRHVYLDPSNDECVHQMPYAPHDHDTHEKLYEELTVLNPAKESCANPEILSNFSGKTSAAKAIFMKEVHK